MPTRPAVTKMLLLHPPENPLPAASERVAIFQLLVPPSAPYARAILGLGHGALWVVVAALTLFFAVFNYLEARLPALLTQAVPAADRGAALGVFATAQFLGAFFGGAGGGLLLRQFGISGVFWGCTVMAFGWALLAGRSGEPATEPVSG